PRPRRNARAARFSFFSGRRRHTRLQGDWSSDVCSSDLSIDVPVCTSDVFLRRYVPLPDADLFQTPYNSVVAWATAPQRAALEARSEERRVGKEGSSRGAR